VHGRQLPHLVCVLPRQGHSRPGETPRPRPPQGNLMRCFGPAGDTFMYGHAPSACRTLMSVGGQVGGVDRWGGGGSGGGESPLSKGCACAGATAGPGKEAARQAKGLRRRQRRPGPVIITACQAQTALLVLHWLDELQAFVGHFARLGARGVHTSVTIYIHLLSFQCYLCLRDYIITALGFVVPV
jgi:hypothetical protein